MQISLFLLLSIFAFSAGKKIINTHLDRILQGSANYGSGPNYSSVAKKSYASYGSGVESKYGSNAKQGSTAKYGSSAKQGSNVKYGSTAKQGSYKQCSRASHDYVFSGTIGSGKNKHYSYAIKGSGSRGGSGAYSGSRGGSGNHGGSAVHGGSGYHASSGPQKGSSHYKGSSSKAGSASHQGSASKGGSGPNKGSGSNRPYDIFTPTMRPTEAMPPIYQPPPPTHYPTSYKSIPIMPITFNLPTIEGIEVPQIPLSFQIEQGANGWAQYPDSPPSDSPPIEKAFTKVAAKTAGVAESSVSDMKIKKTQRRFLSTSISVSYYITTTPALNGEKTQEEAYQKIVNKLQLSVKNNNFSSELHRLGVKLNVSSISFYNYAVIYPTLSPTSAINVLSSPGANDQSPLTDAISIGIGILLAIGTLCLFGSLYLKSKQQIKAAREISLTEAPPHLERVSNPMQDVIPDPLRRIMITHTPSPSE